MVPVALQCRNSDRSELSVWWSSLPWRAFAWLTRYNTRRRHSANRQLSPDEYERRHHTAKLTLAA
jgi:transposase InsO family protein